jgi:hypothetical protein
MAYKLIQKSISQGISFSLLFALIVGCKKEEPQDKAPRIKRVVKVESIETRFIELDNGDQYGMGENLYNRIVTRLQNSKKFVVVVDEPGPMASTSQRSSINGEKESVTINKSDRLRFRFAPLPAGELSAKLSGLIFTHGSKGLTRTAGFRPDFFTPYNDGTRTARNEFPARSLELSNGWFGQSFAPLGEGLNSSIAGVDAGAEGEFNLAIANVNYRRDRYFAQAIVDTNISLINEGTDKPITLDARGEGFLFALGVGYQNLSIEFGLVRRTALKNTFDQAVEKMAAAVEEELFRIPFRTRVESLSNEGIVLNAGRREGLIAGDQFRAKSGNLLKVTEVFQIGSIAQVVSGPSPSAGEILDLVEAGKEEAKSGLAVAARESVESERKIRRITLDPIEFHDADGRLSRANIAKGLLMPLLLWRYSQYDQAPDKKTYERKQSPSSAGHWPLEQIAAPAVWNRGLTGKGVKIAIIDSGIDYNHNALGSAFNRSSPGFDWMSFDPRPFDDNSHGTALAGIIASQGSRGAPMGLAPGVELISQKAFDPYGNSTSAALMAATDGAIRSGARIVLLAWDTRKDSQALRQAISRAGAAGLLVVTAAGDRGVNIADTNHFPAGLSVSEAHVISVAAIGADGSLVTEQGRFSNFGPVDIAGPGGKQRVLSPRNEVSERSGTDLAAAYVAASAAILLETQPDLNGPELKAEILRRACTSEALAGKTIGSRYLCLQNF